MAQRRTLQSGSGIEFSEHREYTPGDDLRYMDWNIYARHGDLLLKRFQEEQDLHVYLLLDCSRSMGVGVPGKFDLARQVSAALSYVALADLDRISIVACAAGVVQELPVTRGKDRILSVLQFLERLETDEVKALYAGIDERWNGRVARLNERLRSAQVPVQVANLSTVWTVFYTMPSRYHWMFQFYLRAEGLALSWIGTGRLIFSLNYTEADFEEVAARFVRAAQAMQADGWWWENPGATDRLIRRSLLKEAFWPRSLARK